MKHYLLFLLFLSAVLPGCEKEDGPSSVTLRSITREKFDYKGGLATAVVDAGGRDVTVRSSQPWCRTAVIGPTVSLNVLAHAASQARTAVVTVEAEGLAPLQIGIAQDEFRGILVSPATLVFSETDRILSVSVTSSGDYDVQLTENPNDAFAFTKTDYGVSFESKRPAGRVEVKGRAVLAPDEGDPVIVTLIQPRKSTYDYLLGTWSVTRSEITGGSASLAQLTFGLRENQYSYDVSIDDPALKDYPLKAQFVDGRVVIQSGQELGFSGSKYYTLHFNGPINGQGVYIFSRPNQVAWSAEPVFDDETRTIRLEFSDNGQGNGSVAQTLAIFENEGRYFSFTTPLLLTNRMELSKNY